MSLIVRAARARPRTSKRTGVPAFAEAFVTGGKYNAVDMNDPMVSLQTVAIWAAQDLIRSLVSEMPLDVLDGTTTVKTPTYLLDPGGDGYGFEDWLSRLVADWLMGGNAFGEVVEFAKRGPMAGRPTQIELLTGVSATLESGRPKWMTSDGREIPRNTMRHLRVYPRSGYIMGLSPIGYHMTTVGATVSANRYGLNFFQDSAIPSAILRNTEQEIGKDKARTIKARWMAAMEGAREPVVWGRGWEYQQIQVSPNESQFLETQRYGAKECCTLYGAGVAELLGYGDAQTMTYANIVDRRADFLALSGDRWVRRAERVINMMLPPGQKARLNRNALLRSTTLDRFKAYALALDSNWVIPNEVREWEDMEPTEWGNTPVPRKPAAAPTDGGTSQ